MLDASDKLGLINDANDPLITHEGKSFFSCMGIDVDTLQKGKRPLCRHCLDWSERRNHLGGALGAALLKNFIDKGWARREEGRVIAFSLNGAQAFAKAFQL
jgi:hypothetical protein